MHPTSNQHRSVFVPGGYSDDNAGGWVISEVIRNLQICISEKSSRIAKVSSKYSEWWLVLVNYIDPALDQEDVAQVRALVRPQKPWHKIILVSSTNYERAFEL
jgi:hypothetical protein